MWGKRLKTEYFLTIIKKESEENQYAVWVV